ncbi:MAG: hypothetical protein K2R98_10015 [Gemmataceae bacterium]|nr:hypothetical protein [Gemmataceae bacterium]
MYQMIRQQLRALRFTVALGMLLLATSAGRAQSGAESSVGYIDSAIPRSQFRLRYDTSYGNNRPDRAEFFWPGPSGPPFGESNVDFQDVSTYLEWAASPRFSVFVELPVRFVNPDVNPNAGGLSDLNAGFKWAMVAEEHRYFTLQLKAFAPTGNGGEGLGTNHATLEPGLLFNQRLTDRILLEGELRDWIPLGGSNFAGNVLRYGLGISYDIRPAPVWRVSPVVEFVGWTTLSGMTTNGLPDIPISAVGDTIFNVKGGVRVNCGEHSDFYVGYGRALTGDVWYKDTVRLEYRFSF